LLDAKPNERDRYLLIISVSDSVSSLFDKELDFGGGKKEKVPEGYWKGLVLSYIQSSCRGSNDPVYEKLIAPAISGAGHNDVLLDDNIIKKLSLVGLENFQSAGPKNLKAVYAVEFALGIHESGGGHDTGVEKEGDLSVCETHTAGTWQTSMNSENGMDSKVLTKLNQDYSDNNSLACKTAVFRQGVTPKLEYSAEANCQAFERKQNECPGYAAEYNAVFLRKSASHHGPIKNGILSIPKEVVDLYNQVDNYISKKGCPSFGRAT
jgi:hypothetical protein